MTRPHFQASSPPAHAPKSAFFARLRARARRARYAASLVLPLWSVAGGVVGCSKKSTPNPTNTSVSSAAVTRSPAVGSASAAGAAEPLKIGFAYVGPVGDAGWTFAHDRGRKEIEAEFAGKVKTTFVENVPEAADAERVFRDLVDQGNHLIFGTTFGYMEPILAVAAEAKDVRFEHATGYKTSGNVRTYDARTYEGAYLAGVIAGAMTKTNTLGVVASIPIPEVIRNIDSFTLGAQSVNAKVSTKVVWVNKWFDPPREAEAAQALLNQGVDVLMQNTDSSAVLQTAEKAGKFAFGWDSDMTKYGPAAHLASAIINWGPYYKKAVRDTLEGTWKTEQSWWGLKDGAIDLVGVSEKVPPEVKQKLQSLKNGLKEGSFAIWRGPIADQAGKEMLPDGQVADDKFLRGINFYVKGVEGKLPAGK